MVSERSIYDVLGETAVQLRKGAPVTRETVTTPVLVESESGDPVGVDQKPVMEVVHIYDMPHVDEARPELERVDLHFVEIGVDRKIAEGNRDEIISWLDAYPQPERFRLGPSYIEIGGVIGDQGAALMLFAVGEVLGLWKVITPATLGATGAKANEMAGMGYVMISGYEQAD